ncbi:hypothetical protein CC77DRAFT_1023293 [Alternaria alternata]|uniref:Uncharacterized protein n=1 Tax=Alternaria alternata TaxID=5599 RepID=A0A177DBS8_ALTAL|nr:hypothetical protein CC77DRAFT_1023293 [Alternaria alternata]OAG17125.1 hypothetical protein CC77DRAFT_1023293 [Alternaria alternata]
MSRATGFHYVQEELKYSLRSCVLPNPEKQIQAFRPLRCPSPWCFASHLRCILVFLLPHISDSTTK